jgi:hypothetical protein
VFIHPESDLQRTVLQEAEYGILCTTQACEEELHPKTQRVIPNPQNPNIAGSMAMGVRHRCPPTALTA